MKSGKEIDLDMSCLFVWNYYKKYHPTKWNEQVTDVLRFILSIVDTLLSCKLFEKTCPPYQESELQQWFRHNIRVERREDKINDFLILCVRRLAF